MQSLDLNLDRVRDFAELDEIGDVEDDDRVERWGKSSEAVVLTKWTTEVGADAVQISSNLDLRAGEVASVEEASSGEVAKMSKR